MNAHVHGGRPELDAQRLSVDVGDVVDFSTSVNPLGVPEAIRTAWPGFLDAIGRYPTQDGSLAVKAFEERLCLPAGSVMAGNGSVELIYSIMRALNPKRVAIVVPSFHDYVRSAMAAGAQVSTLRLDASSGFAPPTRRALRPALEHADAIVLGHPNNPTGTMYDPSAILDLAAELPDRFFLVDEAFVDFIDDPAAATLASAWHLRPNLIVLRSLTKLLAVPGLRVGCAVSDPRTIARLSDHAVPWRVNAVAEQVCAMLETCRPYEERVTAMARAERARLSAAAEGLAGIEFCRPTANFCLARWKRTDDLDDLLRHLLRFGLYVRDCRNMDGLDGDWFRFGLRTPAENDRLYAILRSFPDG